LSSPTPIDALVWSYHALGWSTRRIAGEVQASQSTVVRILDRLRQDPPDNGNTIIMNSTPPGGMPILPGIPASALFDDTQPQAVWTPPRHRPGGVAILTILTLVLLGALAATLAAANGGLIARGQTGPRGPAGQTGPAGSPANRDVTVCVRYDTSNGDIAAITAPVRGSCGSMTTLRIP
jgi:hypothetical protein